MKQQSPSKLIIPTLLCKYSEWERHFYPMRTFKITSEQILLYPIYRMVKHHIYLEMKKFYKPRLVSKRKEACIIWGKILKQHTLHRSPMDGKQLGYWLSRRRQREYDEGFPFFQILFFKKFFLGSSLSYCISRLSTSSLCQSYFSFLVFPHTVHKTFRYTLYPFEKAKEK